MSYSRCLSLSALLASTFITPVTAMDLTPVSSDNNAILEYTHTYTPVPEPASSFADMSRSYQTAGICFLGVGDCDPNVGLLHLAVQAAAMTIIPSIPPANV